MTTIDEIRDNFELLEEWDDRYRYVIELGRTLAPMPEQEHSTANKVQGCASQVWLSRQLDRSGRSRNRLGCADLRQLLRFRRSLPRQQHEHQPEPECHTKQEKHLATPVVRSGSFAVETAFHS